MGDEADGTSQMHVRQVADDDALTWDQCHLRDQRHPHARGDEPEHDVVVVGAQCRPRFEAARSALGDQGPVPWFGDVPRQDPTVLA